MRKYLEEVASFQHRRAKGAKDPGDPHGNGFDQKQHAQTDIPGCPFFRPGRSGASTGVRITRKISLYFRRIALEQGFRDQKFYLGCFQRFGR